MKEIKINFSDFWSNFDKTNNFFYNLLSRNYDIKIDDNPDFIIYSCFGKDYLKYKCIRIFYSGENIRPDFTACDFAFTFDYNTKKNHFRLPLYLLYLDNKHILNPINSIHTREEIKQNWLTKTKFCCMVVSNPNSKKRLEFFKILSEFKRVDSGGGVLNNIGGRVKNKLEFINDYKFVIAFENSSYEGYTTEKILEPISMNCIPIYWGNKLVEKDFNPKRFINYDSFKNEKELFQKLTEIENNPEVAVDILMQHVFSTKNYSIENEKLNILNFFGVIFNSNQKPIAKSNTRYIHSLKIKINRLVKKIRHSKYCSVKHYKNFIVKKFKKL